VSAVRLLLWKDAVSEARGLERVSTLVVFAAAVLMTFHFTLPADADVRPVAAGGFVWATVVFAALLELRRSFADERRDATLDALRAAPVEPSTIFWAKVLSSLGVLAVLEAVLVPLAVLLFGGRAAAVPAAYGVTVAATLGLLAWGTLFAAASEGTRSGDVVLAILLFPLVVPLTIACVRLLAHLIGGQGLEDAATGFVLLGAFDVIALGTGLLLFDYALDA
jgi:heme exporter protein B